MIRQLRVSIGTTWRLIRTDGAVTAELDMTSYRKHVSRLKQGDDLGPLRLPWPRYRSTFWGAMFGGPCKEVADRTLVAALVPSWSTFPLHAQPPGLIGPPEVEVLWHPFAVTTMAHLEAVDVELPDTRAVAAHLDRLLNLALDGPGRRVRDGVSFGRVPPRPSVDADGREAEYIQTAEFRLLSALHEDAPEPKQVAVGLALLFQSKSDVAEPLRDPAGAVSVRGGTVGIVLPASAYRAEAHLRCLHNNQAVLLAQIENLATLLTQPRADVVRRYRELAGVVLNCLYRRAPLPDTGSVYKARVAQMWIDHRQFRARINDATSGLRDGPPPLPV